ncbi:MAG: ureidoglycolate lyase [Ottowia sp.]|nr:ureidoglycolate lyase [Ottowia sp.]
MTDASKGSDAALHTIIAEPLTAGAFAPYGDVVESSGTADAMNQGYGKRYRDLAQLDLIAAGGRAAVSRVTCVPEQPPVPLRLMERHPLSSQLFVPLDGQRYLVVVAPAGDPPRASDIRAFVASGKQGVNYHRGTWHHPMIALDKPCEFLEVHRAGPGKNCDEVAVDVPVQFVLPR